MRQNAPCPPRPLQFTRGRVCGLLCFVNGPIGRRCGLALCVFAALFGCQSNGRGEPAAANTQAAVSSAAAGASAAGERHGQHLLVVVDHDSSGFHVRHAQVVALPLPATRFPKAQSVRADVEDSAGQVMFSAGLPAFGEHRAEFAGPDGGMQAAHFRSDDFSFALRVPLIEHAARFRFWDMSAPPNAGNTPLSAGSRAAGAVELGVAPYPTGLP